MECRRAARSRGRRVIKGDGREDALRDAARPLADPECHPGPSTGIDLDHLGAPRNFGAAARQADDDPIDGGNDGQVPDAPDLAAASDWNAELRARLEAAIGRRIAVALPRV